MATNSNEGCFKGAKSRDIPLREYHGFFVGFIYYESVYITEVMPV